MRVFTIIFISIMIFCGAASADTVYFKDGGKLEGFIKEETEDKVVVDMGFGTMSIRKDEIERIERATPEDIERLEKDRLRHDIETGDWIPEGYEAMHILYERATENKNALKNIRRSHAALRRELSRKERKVSKLLRQLKEKGLELKRTDLKKDVQKYNEIVAQTNSLNADLHKESADIKKLYEEEKAMNKKIQKSASKYRNDFRFFKEALNKSRNKLSEKEATSDELYYLETMDDEAGDMERDFKRDVALYTPEGNQVVVDALLDNTTLARLVVDTGASIVLISSDVAARLGLRYEDIDTEIGITLADGSTTVAKPIVLNSVKVGEAEVTNVQAAILDKGFVGGNDGLLGMSFLNNFIMSIDTAGNQLILEKVL